MRVSVVTPSYNMGRFLRETVESVLAQDYPNIEYVVVDGGSTDDTLDLMKAYEGRLRFCSGPDAGTADAINKGFRLCGGEIFAYLNADDTLMPGAVSKAVREFQRNASTAVVYGGAHWVDLEGRPLREYPVRPFDATLLAKECFISQPASFIRSAVFEEIGMMNPRLRYAFDYDLWIRIAKRYPMQYIPEVLATSRMHAGNKTVGHRRDVLREAITMLRSHYGYVPFSPIHAYASYLADGRDQFFEQLHPSIAKYVLSLFIGLRFNVRCPFRFVREWAGVMSFRGLLRRCHGSARSQ